MPRDHAPSRGITAALGQAPHERGRYYPLAEHLNQLGQHAAAEHLARLAGIDLDSPPT